MEVVRNYSDANNALATYSRPPVGEYSLDRMKRFMNFLGDPQDALRIVHVAGTSGKTSTAYFIESLLLSQDYQVGMTVSPHIDTVSERAQINGAPLPEAEYCEELTDFLDLVEKSNEGLSYFELLVGFAYWEFARKGMDCAVVEVGLGGLLDGTNIVNNPDKVSVITDIGLDHTEILGDTLSKIAMQKAGIILPGSHAFIQPQSPEVMQVVEKVAADKDAILHIVETDESLGEDSGLPLFQVRNLNLAKAVADFISQSDGGLPIAPERVRGAANVYIPARMEEVLFRGQRIILDGSHNPQKVATLVKSFKDRYGEKPVPLMVSFGQNKQADIFNTLSELRELGDEIILTKFTLKQDEIRQAIDPDELRSVCEQLDFKQITVISDPKQAFKELCSKDSEVALVTGSYFLLNHIRPLITQ